MYLFIMYLWLKKFFSGMNIKKFFDPHVSCRPGRVTVNQHIFKVWPETRNCFIKDQNKSMSKKH